MSRTSCVVALVLATVFPGLAAAQDKRSGDPPGRRGYQEHDRVTNATFTVTADAGGNAVLTLRGGDFSLEKVVSPSGDATIRLTQGKDIVTIAISSAGFQVARGRRAVRLDPRTDKGEALDAVRALLVGSQTVRSFKRLAASIEDRDESEPDGPLALAALVDGAVVQLLDGDADAPRRIAKRITRKHRAAIRAIKARAPGAFVDCVGLYEAALVNAWNQFGGCYNESTEYSWWTRDLVFKLCELEWVLRTQQYLWQFVTCFAFPF
jgi:hypothetical protein